MVERLQMNNYSFPFQEILQNIVARRRSSDRELIRVCDPLGQTSLSGLRIDSDKTLWEVQVESQGMNASRFRRPLSIARGELMLEVAAALGLTPSIELCTDLLVDAVPRPMCLHFQTMAGDGITLVGDEEELSTASVQTFMGCGTNLNLPEKRGSFSAENVVRHFTSRATAKECQLFVKMVQRNPNCAFTDSRYGDKFKLDCREDREQETWFKVLPAIDRDIRHRREKDEECEQVWREVIQSFEDPHGRFSQMVRLVNSLNRVVCADNLLFREGSRRYTVLMEAKQGFLKHARMIVQALNAGELDELQRDLSILQHRLWSIQHAESDEHKRKLEAWLNDPTLNRYGIPRGVINRYRYELSLHSDNVEKALQIRDSVHQRDKGICQYCGKEIATTRRAVQTQEDQVVFYEAFHIDHVLPLARGGTNDLRNLQLLCGACNLSCTFRKNLCPPDSHAPNFRRAGVRSSESSGGTVKQDPTASICANRST